MRKTINMSVVEVVLLGIASQVIFLVTLAAESTASHHSKVGDQYLMRPRPAKGYHGVAKLQVSQCASEILQIMDCSVKWGNLRLQLSTLDILQEPPGSKYDPRPEDMDIRQLRLKLGKNFDPQVMSIRKPHDLAYNPNGTVKFPFKRNKKGRLVPTGEVII